MFSLCRPITIFPANAAPFRFCPPSFIKFTDLPLIRANASKLTSSMESPPPDYRRNVGICLINPSNKIFSASRLDIPGAWQMPQGGVDEGEDPRTAAIRELREETGVISADILAEASYWLTYDFPPEVREKLNKQWGTNWKGQAQKWKEYFEIPWANLRSKVDPSFAEKSVFKHSEYLTNGELIISTATNVTETEVLTVDGHEVAYNYLVIATGHVPSNPRSRRDRLEQFQEDNFKIKNSGSILIIGGGPMGVELAGEIAVDYPDKKVTLVHNGPRLLEFIGRKAGNKALDWLKSKNVEVLLDQSIDLESISEADRIFTTSVGETIHADSYFVCVDRFLGSSWLRESILKERINGNGRLMVDESLRVAGHTNIFAIGDITDIPELKQGMTAQKHAMVVAKNIKMLLKGNKENKLLKYKAVSAIAIVSLGRNNAVVHAPFLTVMGSLPGKIKSRDLYVTRTRKQMGLDLHSTP